MPENDAPVGAKNLLHEITKDRELPEGYDGWLIRSVYPDLRSLHGFRYPYPGQVAKAPGPINSGHAGECPSSVGDGICAATSWYGMASGGIPARTLLLVAYRESDVLGRSEHKLRLSEFMVVDVVDGERLAREHGNGANLYGANLRSADLYGADLYGADLRSANLRSANLYGANLRSAIGLTQAQVTDAHCDNWTRLPSGLVIPQ